MKKNEFNVMKWLRSVRENNANQELNMTPEQQLERTHDRSAHVLSLIHSTEKKDKKKQPHSVVPAHR